MPYSVIVYLDLGLRQPRLEGEEYLSVVDEFMEVIRARWPKAVVQVCLL
jgi:malate dehydrogenase (decarboxylating)